MGSLKYKWEMERILAARQMAANVARMAEFDFASGRIDYETYQRELAKARQILIANGAV